jgi:UDP-glucose 4-epimerase
VPYAVLPRRPGDVASVYADPARAQELLGWRAQHGLARMCEDSWRWQSNNPKGFEA